jgi:uncharacterized protein
LDAPDRVVALDLIRGVAVLGILVINIAGLAGPTGATLSPHIPAHGSFADELVYAFGMVVFEGKMRALFTILFGASMLLFIERAEAGGRDGDVLQLRRLGWLALFGCLHFFLFWWGDILFSYAVVGIIALFMRELSVKVMLAAALLIFAGWHLGGAAMEWPEVRGEEQVRLGTAQPAEARKQNDFRIQIAQNAQREMIEYRSGFREQIRIKLERRPLWLVKTTWPNVGETLPLMLIGMVLFRTGFFTAEWERRRLRQVAVLGTASGLALTAAMLAWLWPRGFPPQGMSAALLFWLAIPHLLMAAGYAALLVLAAPRLAATALGRRLVAAGRMAFSNYIGTTVVMTAIFYGWGLGLVGQVGRVAQLGYVAFAWALMLGWSLPWLERFRQGPLEWLWRSLTERRPLPFRRHAIAIHSQ